jgi:hypothetical protein
VTLAQWFAYDNTPVTADPVETWLNRLKMFPVEIANYKAGRSTNWEDLIYQNGFRQDHTIGLSGKKDEVSYYLSLGYTDNKGLTVGDQYKNARTRLNLEGKAADFATFGVNFQYASRDESAVPIDFGQIRNASPLGEKYKEDGVTLRPSPNDDLGNNRNPFLDNVYRERMLKYNTIFSTIYIKGNLPLGFSYSVNVTPSYDQTREFNHYSADHPDYVARRGFANRIETTRFNWQIDNILKWNMTFDKMHRFDVTLLANAEKLKQTSSRIENEGFDPNDDLGYHNIGSGTKPIVSSNDIVTTGDALMARLNYTLNEKYMLTATIRRDGYSAFGQRNPRATFPSLALGWVFSDEGFMKSVTWVNRAKLRLSYGAVGNRDIDGYLALSNLNTGKYLYVNNAGTVLPVTQLYVDRMVNKDLKWESTASFNGGLDFTLFNNVIDGSLEVYRKNTSDLLLLRALPSVTGFFNVASNLGNVTNTGFELALSSNNIKRDNFS